MPQDLVGNGVIRFDVDYDYISSEESSLLMVIDSNKLPDYERQIVQPFRRIYKDEGNEGDASNIDELVGVIFFHGNVGSANIIGRTGTLVDKVAKKYQLWQIPFTPEKEEEGNLDVLLKTVAWHRKGKVYVPDRMHFDDSLTPAELKRVIDFYQGFQGINQ